MGWAGASLQVQFPGFLKCFFAKYAHKSIELLLLPDLLQKKLNGFHTGGGAVEQIILVLMYGMKAKQDPVVIPE